MADAATKIPVTVELGGALRPLAEHASAARIIAFLSERLDADLALLGLPGEASVKVDETRSNRAVRVLVNGHWQPFPPALLERIARIVDPAELHRATRASRAGHNSFPDEWLHNRAAGAETESDWSSLTDIIGRLALEVTRQRPSCLFGRKLAAAYLGEPRRREHATALASTIDLGVPLASRERVISTVRQSRDVGLPPDDVAEVLFDALRADRIELRARPDVLERIIGAPVETEARVDAYGDAATSGPLGKSAAGLFHDLGVRLPPLVCICDGDTDEESVEIRINHRPTVPYRAPDENAAWPAFAAGALADSVRRRAGELVGMWDVEHSLALLERISPQLVRAGVASFSIADITRVVRALVTEGAPIRDLRAILDRLLSFDTIPEPDGMIAVDGRLPVPADLPSRPGWPEYLAFLRAGLRYRLSWGLARDGGVLQAIQVSADLEERAASRAQTTAHWLREAEQEALLDRLWSSLPVDGEPMIVLVERPAARLAIRTLTSRELPELPVLARWELAPGISIGTIATVSSDP